MSSKPIVSIIIPVYNSEKYLKRCLDSVINQTLHDIEIICINDASTDSSLRILEEYETIDSRIRVFSNDKNRGLAYTRNRGIDIATSKYLGFVDSDDTIESKMYEILLDKSIVNNSCITICNYKKVNDTIKVNKFRASFSKDEIFSKILSRRLSSTACNKLYNKEFLIKNRLYFPEDRLSEDSIVACKIVYFAKVISVVEDEFYNYYNNEGSITREITDKYLIDIVFNIEDTKKFLVETGLFYRYKKEFTLMQENYIQYLIYKLSQAKKEGKAFFELILKIWNVVNKFKKLNEFHYSKDLLWAYSSSKMLKNNNYYLDLFLNKFSQITATYIKDSLDSNLGLSHSIIKRLAKKDIKKVYLYGAGDIAQKLIPEIEKLDIEILSIIDSNAKEGDSLLGYLVDKFDNIDFQTNVIVVASESSAYEITKFLKNQDRDFEIINFYS